MCSCANTLGQALREPGSTIRIPHTRDLKELRTWLKHCKVTEIAMESTGQYLRPILERASVKPVIADVPVKRPKRVRKVEADEPDLIAAK